MSKNLYVCLFGGLGNQLFQYAYAKNLQIKYKFNLIVDHKTGFFLDFRDKRKFELNDYLKYKNKKQIFFFLIFKIYKKIFNSKKKIHIFFNKKLIDETYCKAFEKSFLSENKFKGLYLHGFFQSDKYFSENKSLIVKELMPKKSKKKIFLNLASKLNTNNSVAIGIRLFEGVNSRDLFKIGGKLDINYFKKNLKFFKEKLKEPHFYIFSNEESVELYNILEKLDISLKNYTLITPKKGFGNSHDTLWLLSLFKYQLISNSTFYWWGAYFAKHRYNKILIKYPKCFPNKDTVYKGLF